MKPVKIALITPILLGFLCATVSAQKFSYRSWLIKEISKDTAFKGRLNIILRPGSKPFFWPEDGPYKSADYNFQNEHLVKSKTGFLTVIEGTGRVYKIELDENEKDGLKFTRLDSTIFFGYNFGATVFYLRDTLYSLGGYGLWNFPWHLRYFRPSSYGWEVVPINKEVPHIYSPHTYFLDEKRQKLFSIESNYFNEGLKPSNPRSQNMKRLEDTVYVDRLDLNSKNWERIGMLTPEFRKILYSGYFICDTPFGKILTTGDRFGNKGYLYDFSSNRVKEVANKKLATQLHDALLSGKNNSSMPERFVTYYIGDSIKLLNSSGFKFSLKITDSDFKETGIKMWVPTAKSSILDSSTKNQISLIVGISALCLGLWFFFRSKITQVAETTSNEFDKQELKLITALGSQPGLVFKPDDVDQLLENGARSPDALKKRRSMLIRSINKKYSEQYDDEEDLIKTERLESDRRMVQYVMDEKKYKRAQKALKQ